MSEHRSRMRDAVVVIGAGHNGLICACYLALAGLDVLVLEQAAHIGGACWTEETISGFRFDTHAVAHNMINMTDIPRDLRLDECGLDYLPMDPFATALSPNGPPFRLYRDLERTCAEIARTSPGEARAYRRFVHTFDPLVAAALEVMAASGAGARLRALPGQIAGVARMLHRLGPGGLAATLAAPYRRLLDEYLPSERLRAPVAALAAHATVGPDQPGGAFYAIWQAAYHRSGMWHPRGGSASLPLALERRLLSLGGRIRTGADVARIELRRGRAAGVALRTGEQIAAGAVVAAINPKIALLELLPAEAAAERLLRRMRATTIANAVQFVVHVALHELPPYRDAPGPDCWNGMAALTRDVAQVRRAFAQAIAGEAPEDPPVYAFTPSAGDASLAPPGQHTLYLACPAYPYRFADGRDWRAVAQREAERLAAAMEAYAPGLRERIIDLVPRTPAQAEQEIRLLGGHPMHLDLTPDQLFVLRPLPGLGRYRTPVPGLYLSGAGTNPAGGVLGAPGRNAAKRLLADRRIPRI